MPSFELEESDYAGPIEDDTILGAELVAAKIVEKENRDKTEKYNRVEFKFTIDEEGSPWDGTNLWGETATKFNTHPDCKLRNWSQEILATEFPVGYRLDTDVLLGNKCRVIVGAREYNDKDGNPKVYNFVKDVLRSRSSMAAEF